MRPPDAPGYVGTAVPPQSCGAAPWGRADPVHAARIRVTHSYVLAEFVALAHARRLPRMAALTFVRDLVENPDIETVWVDEALHRAAMALLLARPDKTYSLCDAVSFVLMRQRHVTEAFTTDRHFEQEGFQRLL